MMRSARFVIAIAVLFCLSTLSPAHAYVVLKSVSVAGEGTPSETSSMQVQLINGSELTGQTNSGVISYAQYLRVNFSSTLSGFQAVIISTANKEASASPQYTGGGSGSGLVSQSNTAQNAALHWVVHETPVSGGYNFASCGGEPVCTSNQFFVADKSESPFPAGYASTLYDINGLSAQLPGAPTGGRSVSNGQFYIYLGANLTGMADGTYKTNRLRVELVTINGDGSHNVHHSYQAEVTGIRV